MMQWMTFFSGRCCGGPVLMLSLALVLFGVMFTQLSAAGLGWVFMGIGIATFGLCLLLASNASTSHAP